MYVSFENIGVKFIYLFWWPCTRTHMKMIWQLIRKKGY